MESKKAITRKERKIDQSRAPHFSIPIKDGDFLDPRRKFTTREMTMIDKARRCFFHYLTWDFSYSSSSSSFTSSSVIMLCLLRVSFVLAIVVVAFVLEFGACEMGADAFILLTLFAVLNEKLPGGGKLSLDC